MFSHPYLLLLLGGVAAACWQQLRSLAQKLFSRLVDEAHVYDLDGPMSTALAVYLRRRPRTRFGPDQYYGGRARVRSSRQTRIVGYALPVQFAVYWLGRVPLLTTATTVSDGRTQLSCRWLRGTVDFDALIAAAADEAHALAERANDRAPSRFCVRRLTGRGRADIFSRAQPGAGRDFAVKDDGRPPTSFANGPGSGGPSLLHHPLMRYAIRPIGHDLADLVDGSALPGSALDRMALSPGALAAFADVREWHASREWYAERDIPYRHGLLFHGPTGNGKTRAVAALGQDLDMPVVSFDLASMSNAEFTEYWGEQVRSYSPCIALFEDIDGVFEGRRNVTGREDGLTFDCFLNALGGVEVADGVLVVITTNRPETLDPAIARVGDKASRPGRIETAVEFGPPDAAGRRKIAMRVLADRPDLAQAACFAAAEDESGAQFLYRCRVLALAARRAEAPPSGR